MKIYEKLDKPEKWTQRTWARRADGQPTAWDNPNAVCFCFGAAMILCYPETNNYIKTYNKVTFKLKKGDIWHWNDHATYEDVFNLAKALDI